MKEKLAEHPRVIGIFIANSAGQVMVSLQEVRAIAGRGLEGDRYAEGRGTTWRNAPEIRHVTLFGVADIAEVARSLDQPLRLDETRRNIAIEGPINLLDLVGKEFQIGEVRMRGTEDCAPCRRLVKLTGKVGLVKAMAGKAGIRAEIMTSGLVRVGDKVSA